MSASISNASHSAVTAITQGLEQLDRAAEGVRRASLPPRELSPASAPAHDSLDLSTEAVRLLTARTAVQAGLELAATVDEIETEAIDLLA